MGSETPVARSNRGAATNALLVMAESQEVMARFIQTELDFAVAFCKRAANSTDTVDIHRSLKIAGSACKMARRFLRYLKTESVPPPVIQNLERKMVLLEKLLNGALPAKNCGKPGPCLG
jgi:hypothetical protein